MGKKTTKLSEEDVRAKHIDPALKNAGWSESQIRREVTFTEGQIIVRGKTVSRGAKKRVDYILYYKPNIPVALIEAKDSSHSPADGMQQALNYADQLDIPFVYSTNGKKVIQHNRISKDEAVESELAMQEFPGPDVLFQEFKRAKNLDEKAEKLFLQDYFQEGHKTPRYYQQNAINRTTEAIARGKDRLLLVMATGTGKTYTAFQIIWRLWKARKKKRILFLVDRTALAQQTRTGDFKHFGDAMTKIDGEVDKAYEIYIALYQGLMSGEQVERFKQFSEDFFDLVIVDECHRGSAREDSQWRDILDYYSSATQIGLTATPKQEKDGADNLEYFGEPVYTYSLKQGIEDGFLAPYKVIRYILDKDIEWRPDADITDEDGNPIPDEVYNGSDYDGRIIIDARTRRVANLIAGYMEDTDPMQKTIVFCRDIAHAERMRKELTNALPEYARDNSRYVVRITGDNEIGKREIENFINPEESYPVIATTSQLLSTGVDTKTAKLIVLDKQINSMTEFKQIIGRGTRVEEQYGKYYFTIMDFRGATRHFADPEFDGEPFEMLEEKQGDEKEIDIRQQIEQETESEEEIKEHDPREDILIDGTEPIHKPKKIRVRDGVEFFPVQKTVRYIDPETGKLVTESLKDFTKSTILKDYASLDDFLTRWQESERKDIIVNELIDRGVLFEELRKEVGRELDVFDLILHVAYGKKPLTRSERVKSAKKEDYFSKYEGEAREIIDLLLEKYEGEGITAIDDIGDLQVAPFTKYGTPVQIVNDIFGGREHYIQAVQEVEKALYRE